MKDADNLMTQSESGVGSACNLIFMYTRKLVEVFREGGRQGLLLSKQ
jgi:hypothetical protein